MHIRTPSPFVTSVAYCPFGQRLGHFGKTSSATTECHESLLRAFVRAFVRALCMHASVKARMFVYVRVCVCVCVRSCVRVYAHVSKTSNCR